MKAFGLDLTDERANLDPVPSAAAPWKLEARPVAGSKPFPAENHARNKECSRGENQALHPSPVGTVGRQTRQIRTVGQTGTGPSLWDGRTLGEIVSDPR